MTGTKPSNKRKKSLTPEPATKKKQQTLLSAFAKIDRAIAVANPTRPPVIDLTNKPAVSGGQAASGAAQQQASQQKSASQCQPQKSVSHVSASFVEFNQTKKTATATSGYQPSVSHVSDSYKPRSVPRGRAASHAAAAQLHFPPLTHTTSQLGIPMGH